MSTRKSRSAILGLAVSTALAVLIPATCAFGSEPALTLEEIIVTAQKRSENVQSVPSAISAFSAEDIAKNGINNWAEIQGLVPGLVLDPAYGSMTTPKMFIRGIGVDNNVFSFDSPIGLYIDGVYLARVIGGFADMVDVDRIEVLRGPQGTLYGRNNSIGAVSLHTQLPPLDKADIKVGASVGSYEQRDALFSVGAPLIEDKLGVRLSFDTRNNDGYQREATTGRRAMGDDVKAVRAAIRYVPNEALEVVVRADYMADNSPDAVGWRFRNSDGTLNLGGNPFVFNESPNTPIVQHTDPSGISATINWHAAPFDVTSVTAYRHLRFRDSADVDGRSDRNSFEVWRQDLDQNQVTEELFASSRGADPSAVKWVVGAFYLKEKNDFAWQLNIFGLTPTTFYHQTTDSTAGYAQATIPVAARWSVTAGVRYTTETKDLTAQQTDPDGAAIPGKFADSIKANKFNYRLSVDYKVRDNVLAYLSDATGFRSGGFNGSATDLPSVASGAFGPEDTNTAEIGLKSDLWARRLRLNADYFYAKYRHLQQAITDPTTGAITTTNADATVKGLELEATALITENWQTNLTLSNTRQGIDGTSSVLKQTPEWMWRLGTFYSLPIQGLRGTLRAGASVNYSGGYFQDSASDPLLRTHAYYVADANMAYERDGGHWSVRLQGMNLGNRIYPVGGFNIFDGIISSVWYTNLPRRWLLSAKYRY